jgi:predicted permease
MSGLIIRLASLLVPGARRAEWRERWYAELWVLDEAAKGSMQPIGRLSFAMGVWPDAFAEHLDGWREGWSLAGLSADVRDGWRVGLRAPLLTIITIAILGVGTTAATTIFSLADRVLLQPPPGIVNAGELVQIGRHSPTRFDNFSYPNFTDLAAGLDGTIALAGYTATTALVGVGAAAEVLPVQAITRNYFRVLGTPVAHGPGLTPGDDAGYTHSDEVIVSAHYWRDHGDAIRAAGGALILKGRTFRVVGVAPEGFVGADPGRALPAAFVPLAAVRGPENAEVFLQRDNSWIWVVGRRHPGVTEATARTAVESVHARILADSGPAVGETITVDGRVGFRPNDRAEANSLVSALFAIAALVLVIACANVTSLQVARAIRRRREMAVRLSIGASRLRLLRALLVEQGMLAAAGAALAFALTFATTRWLKGALPYEIGVSFGPNLRVLSFALIAGVGASLVVALWPLARVARAAPLTVVKAEAAGPVHHRSSAVLLVAQAALSALLVTTGGLFLRSTIAAGAVQPGFDPNRTLVVALRDGGSADQALARQRLVDRLAALPGVDAVGLASSLPIVEGQARRGISPPPDAALDVPFLQVVTTYVDAGYFDALGLPIVEGRPFEQDEGTADELPAVITGSLARMLSPGRTALGLRFTSGPLHLRVVGVTAPVGLQSLRNLDALGLWLPASATNRPATYVLLRTRIGPAAMVSSVREASAALSSEVVAREVTPLAPRIAASMSEVVTATQVTITFALVALLITAAGIYGVAAAQVVRRRREFGIRLALGETPSQLIRRVLRTAVAIAGTGTAFGVATSVLAGPQLGRFLFNVDAADPVVLVTTAGTLVLVAAASAIGPACRASRIDPIAAIKDE